MNIYSWKVMRKNPLLDSDASESTPDEKESTSGW